MNRYTLVNSWSGETLDIEAINFYIEDYVFIFYIFDKENNKITRCAYATRNWDIRNVKKI